MTESISTKFQSNLDVLFPQTVDTKGNFTSTQGAALSFKIMPGDLSIGLGASLAANELIKNKSYDRTEVTGDLHLNLKYSFTKNLSIFTSGGIQRSAYGTLNDYRGGIFGTAGFKLGKGIELSKKQFLAFESTTAVSGTLGQNNNHAYLSLDVSYGHSIPDTTLFFVSGVRATGQYGEPTKEVDHWSGRTSVFLGLVSIWE
ncbi:hypothetical protein BVY03_05890 [bacterium K02(2017)]|nr:hypothetical protein BVY03_05890 [bacterium K02(2017)]